MNKAHLLTSPWPKDLAETCPNCSYKMDARVNLSYGRYGIAPILKKIAWWAPLPSFPIALIICLNNPDRGLIMAIALGTILPSILLNLAATLVPITRRLYCVKCHHTEYSSAKEWL